MWALKFSTIFEESMDGMMFVAFLRFENLIGIDLDALVGLDLSRNFGWNFDV